MSALHDLIESLPKGQSLVIRREDDSLWTLDICTEHGSLGTALAIDPILRDIARIDLFAWEIDRKAAGFLHDARYAGRVADDEAVVLRDGVVDAELTRRYHESRAIALRLGGGDEAVRR